MEVSSLDEVKPLNGNSKLSHNYLLDTWVLEAPGREKRPIISANDPCPFCPGNEHLTPRQLLSIYTADGIRIVRGFPNKYNLLDANPLMPLDRMMIGTTTVMNGVGAHEVIVDAPEHNQELWDMNLGPSHVYHVLRAYQERIVDLKKDSRFKYVVVFKNKGKVAGASVSHTHCQVVALPFVPDLIKTQIRTTEKFYGEKKAEYELNAGKSFDDLPWERKGLLSQDIRDALDEGKRVILDNNHFICFAPRPSAYPYEMWITPKTHRSRFEESTQEELEDLGDLLFKCLRAYHLRLNSPDYNFMIHNSPFNDKPEDPNKYEKECFHWFIRVVTRLNIHAGFELGTRVLVNTVKPEVCASDLSVLVKEVDREMQMHHTPVRIAV